MTPSFLSLHLADEDATERFGEDLAIALRPGDLVALEGDLGMGKTALARAVIRALADDRALEVPSPTFTLVQAYGLRIPVHHFDLYRLSAPEDLEELGLPEALAEGVALVEWPERAEQAMAGAIRLRLTEKGEGREVRIEGPDDALARIRHSLAVRAFIDGAGFAGARRTFLLGDASIRAYETVKPPSGPPLILMDAPERHDEPAVRDGLPYSRIAHLAQNVTAFVGVANALRAEGFCAPRIHAQALDDGLLLIEHLGSGRFLGDSDRPVAARYEAASRLLAALHERRWPSAFPVDDHRTYEPPAYDREALSIETDLCLAWYMPFALGRPADAGQVAEFKDIWSALFNRLSAAEQSLVLRDFHSPNIVWREDRDGFDRLGLIDVQDAVFGPAAYDAAALAFDARVSIPADIRELVVETYCAARGPGFDRGAFEEAYAITAAQRNTKLLGTFTRLAHRDGKPGYLGHLPRIRGYLRQVVQHPGLARLRQFYEDHRLLEGEAE